jgi:hypothetical protein
MATHNDNPYRSPGESGVDAKKPGPGRARVVWVPLAVQLMATVNWVFVVAWMYWQSLKPGYPFVDHSPPGMELYVLVSFCASALLLPTPIFVIVFRISLRKTWPLRIADLGICAAGLLLSGLQLWLLRLIQYPPIHAI